MQELFDEFIDGKIAQNVSKATIRSYTLSFQRFYLFLGDKTKTSDITEKTIYAFIHRLQEEMVKPTSINHYLREIRAFLYWCMKSNLIKPEFQVTLVKEQEEIKETYTDEELKVLTAKPLKTSFSLKFVFKLHCTYRLSNNFLPVANEYNQIACVFCFPQGLNNKSKYFHQLLCL